MAVMGDRSPEAWMVEWQRSGRVEFPLRRWTFVQFPGLLLIAWVGFTGARVPGMLDDGSWRYVAYLLILGYIGAAVMMVWQLVTQRPVLVVDRSGLHLGRRRFMAWSDIGGIGFVAGSRVIRQLPIQPKDVWAKNLILTQQHVSDLPAFRLWLGQLLDERRGLS